MAEAIMAIIANSSFLIWAISILAAKLSHFSEINKSWYTFC